MVSFSRYRELPPLFDAHIHLTHALDGAYPDHFSYFTNAASPDGWAAILEVKHPGVLPFIGIHPECGSGPIDDIGWGEHLNELEELAETHPIGIGECGIDNRFYQSFTKQEQGELFEVQMAIAQKYHKPVTIHHVHAAEMVISLLKRLSVDIPFIVHGFYGSLQTAKRILDLGGYLSISTNLLRSNEKFKQIAAYIPDDRLFIETDYPYTFIPAPWADYSYAEILYTWYEQVSRVRQIDILELLDIVLRNGTVFTNTASAR